MKIKIDSETMVFLIKEVTRMKDLIVELYGYSGTVSDHNNDLFELMKNIRKWGYEAYELTQKLDELGRNLYFASHYIDMIIEYYDPKSHPKRFDVESALRNCENSRHCFEEAFNLLGN